jgi:hypothetical protein
MGLDKLLIQTLNSGKDSLKKSLELLGSVYFTTDPVYVTIYGASKNPGKHTASS